MWIVQPGEYQLKRAVNDMFQQETVMGVKIVSGYDHPKGKQGEFRSGF